jgi:hypothetical protein
MLTSLPPAVPLPAPKVASFRVNRDRLLRICSNAVTALSAFMAILLFSYGYVLLALT